MPWKREQNNFWQIRLMRECSIETTQTRKENMRKSAKITVLAAIVVVMLAGSASADTTWSGLGGKPNSDGNWNDAANWDPAQVPGVGDTAIVPDVTSDAGKATPNTRTITVGNPIRVDKITTPSGSGGNTNLVQVDSQFTVGQR